VILGLLVHVPEGVSSLVLGPVNHREEEWLCQEQGDVGTGGKNLASSKISTFSDLWRRSVRVGTSSI
jgi:hypothetical protein